MHSLHRLRLRAELGIVECSAISEEGNDELLPVLLSHVHELVDAGLEAVFISIPKHFMEIDAKCVETYALCISEFSVNDFGIEGLRLPELKLVDGIRRDIVAADRPLLCCPPCVSLFLRPTAAVLRLAAAARKGCDGCDR